MNALDYFVLIGTMVSIAVYGSWRTRGQRTLNHYLKGDSHTPWIVIGLSVMATQASAITFISTPGVGYETGLEFVQNYFGAPFALILIAMVFLPMYRRLNVYTAYEFLGRRFDAKTRLLGAALFLLQRGIGAGITIYAPAIVLSTVMGWSLDLTIICSGLLVIIYTVVGGSEAVNLTQKYQIAIIFVGMITAFIVLLSKMPTNLTFSDTLAVAGGLDRLKAVDYSLDPNQRYTIWSGLLGGIFLQLSYFGTDQSQVQRYISGTSLRESRLGLMFNAVCKIPMQFFILFLGVLLFTFYQFEKPPVFFNQTVWAREISQDTTGKLKTLDEKFTAAHARTEAEIEHWVAARHTGDVKAEAEGREKTIAAFHASEAVRADAKKALVVLNPSVETKDSDYVFITFILHYLPHGMIGLLVAVFFAAAMSSKAGELNALGSTTIVDLYRHVIKREASDAHYVFASKCFTVFWGLVAIAFALFAKMSENLIEAGNIVGSVFYGVPLALFLTAFFLKWIGGTAIFWAAIVTQALVFYFYFRLPISYLWYNLIGCGVCMLLSILFQAILPRPPQNAEAISNP